MTTTNPTSFVTSVADTRRLPELGKPEVVMLGRSNSGKSSLINALTSKKLAYVSSTPGKTNLLNYFLIENLYGLVDVPGYGFAKRSGSEVMGWKQLVEGYVEHSVNLAGAVLIVDCRRTWSEDEAQLLSFLQHFEVPVVVVFSKSDKLNRRELSAKVKEVENLNLPGSVFFISNLTGDGVSDLRKFIVKNWVKDAKSKGHRGNPS